MTPIMVQIGDLVISRVDYRAPDGRIKGKTRPLIIISRPNSKGDILTIAGSTKLHQWLAEPHIVVHPETIIDGCLGEATIFPASKQILINPAFIKVKIGRICTPDLNRLRRLCAMRHTSDFFEGCHKPAMTSSFIPGKSRIPYAGRVYDEKEMIHLVDASMGFWLTTGRYAERFEKELTAAPQRCCSKVPIAFERLYDIEIIWK